MKKRLLSVLRTPFLYGHYLYDEDAVLESGALEVLKNLSPKAVDPVLNQAETFFNVRPEMGLYFILEVEKILEVIPLEQLSAWSTTVLDLYDIRGLLPAKEYISELGSDSDPSLGWGEGLALSDVTTVLENYAKGLTGRDIKIGRAEICYTDTETIYLPDKLAIFPEDDDHFLLYKLMVTHKWAQLAFGTYQLDLRQLQQSLITNIQGQYGIELKADLPAIDSFSSLFPDPNLAMDIFNLAETVRLEHKICTELEGIGRAMVRIKLMLASEYSVERDSSPQTCAVKLLGRWLLKEDEDQRPNGKIGEAVEEMVGCLTALRKEGATAEDTASVSAMIYRILEKLPGPYRPVDPLIYQGDLRPAEAEITMGRRLESNKLKFQELLKRVLGQLPESTEIKFEVGLDPEAPQMKRSRNNSQDNQWIPDQLLVDGKPILMPEAMRKVVHEILEDVGYIPSSYLMSGAKDMSGHHFRPLVQMQEEDDGVGGEEGQDVFIYDEWDHRRNGYRKNWCQMRETLLPAGDEDFVSRTLSERAGMVTKIRLHFERLRLENRRLRRQQEGEDIDLDAAVEAFADIRSGLNPSDQLMIRRQRNERSVATAFLIDMSGSTKGWINRSIKEALVMMSEALEILGDRYAIYGFSGMTKKRCELYRIKSFAEAYSDEVKSRISGIEPKDYTRMGPPIRHMGRLLSEEEARVRLLVTLSDGKPDDYDSYKGDYAIEDTRQALIEAKQKGIHPFCITIDKAAHSYIAHMYGEVNYIFLNDVRDLPYRLAEIYRRLTI
jgi:nitric oxide reductase NorD protein